MATKATTVGADLALAALLDRAAVHVGLSTATAATATQAAAGELAGSGYGRLAKPGWTKSDAAGGRQWANDALLRFAFTGAVAGTVKSVQFWSAANAGNLLATIDLVAPIGGLVDGSRIDFAAGELSVTV